MGIYKSKPYKRAKGDKVIARQKAICGAIIANIKVSKYLIGIHLIIINLLSPPK